jgi:hypothetical protein
MNGSVALKRVVSVRTHDKVRVAVEIAVAA